MMLMASVQPLLQLHLLLMLLPGLLSLTGCQSVNVTAASAGILNPLK